MDPSESQRFRALFDDVFGTHGQPFHICDAQASALKSSILEIAETVDQPHPASKL
eukprot:COSAG05_NODE_20488_length_279_cov_0.566667_1_plen_54_part_01